MPEPPQPLRIAVLGSGLAGLTTAYLLTGAACRNSQPVELEVHVYDKSTTLGLDAATLVMEDGTRLETPMRAAQGGYYARVLSMYRHLGIETNVVDFDFSIHKAGRRTLFLYEGANGLRFDPFTRPADQAWAVFLLSGALVVISYLYIISWSLFYWARGHYRDLDHDLHRMTLGEWCARSWLASFFIEVILYPLFAAVTTSSVSDVARTPAADVLEYIAKTFGRKHYLSDMHEVGQSLLTDLPPERLHLGSEITSLSPSADGGLTLETADGLSAHFDHVISCLPPSRAACLSRTFAKALEAQSSFTAAHAEAARSDILSRFPSRTAHVVNHSDPDGARLPRSLADRRLLNLDLASSNGSVSGTHVIRTKPPLLQTTNPSPDAPIDPEKLLSEASFERAITTVDSRKALRELWPLQGERGLWFAGSWCAAGIPLLEGCVVSAETVARELWGKCELETEVPW